MENGSTKTSAAQTTANEICMEFDAISENEGLARVVIAAFLSRIDPTVDEIEDVKTAVSEAVTNAVIHGYGERGGRIVMRAHLSEEKVLSVDISDKGVGIADVEQAMQPLFTTGAAKERSGMGFSFMEAFMDQIEVESSVGEGTCIHMWKRFAGRQDEPAPILQAAVWNRSGRA
ncbi:MAG: anti-sigma F factor [Lachnospiraceae bacterium]|nr:anti-sigma F factor [Lachnospiraceae bacterium]MDE6942447.1 anti-sigma F factor [Lachnospiraceae bacterium]